MRGGIRRINDERSEDGLRDILYMLIKKGLSEGVTLQQILD